MIVEIVDAAEIDLEDGFHFQQKAGRFSVNREPVNGYNQVNKEYGKISTTRKTNSQTYL